MQQRLDMFLYLQNMRCCTCEIVPYQAAEKQQEEEAADDEANKISNEIEALELKKKKIQDKIEGN